MESYKNEYYTENLNIAKKYIEKNIKNLSIMDLYDANKILKQFQKKNNNEILKEYQILEIYFFIKDKLKDVDLF